MNLFIKPILLFSCVGWHETLFNARPSSNPYFWNQNPHVYRSGDGDSPFRGYPRYPKGDGEGEGYWGHTGTPGEWLRIDGYSYIN